ncbi:MAG TPA: mechanosensitive ion channel family protein [Verrucomicrobiae bacterium]|nr:mechanosensitive ion channel family protein [Verrucomicrobiae bacterium]
MPELTQSYRGLVFLLGAPGLYLLLVWFGRRLKRQHGVKLGWLYHLFSLGLAAYLPAVLLGFPWTFLHHLGAAVIVLASTVVIALVDRYLWEVYFQGHHGATVPKFLTELVRFLILAVAVFLVLEFGYNQTIKGLLIAPGIAAVIIGLAMQDLVGNIIAGVALQVGRSFGHGDWLVVENRQGEVIEINWRSTRLKTLDDFCIEIPNREVARQTLINLNRPHRPYAMRIPVLLDYATPPTRAKNVLLHAASNAQGVLPEPKPKVYLRNFGDSGIEYEIKFWMDDYHRFSDISDAIRTNVWYGLRRHGIRMPYPTRTIQLERPARDKHLEVQTAARLILRQQPLFKCLTDEQLDALLPRGKVVHFGRGETVIRQGDNGDSMFILVEGAANVVAERNGRSKQVGEIKAGECFGEMSLLTGELRSATVVASSDCEVVEIDKAVLGQSLKQNPGLLAQLSELLAQRQLQTEDAFAESGPLVRNQEARQSRYAASFIQRIGAFFEL